MLKIYSFIIRNMQFRCKITTFLSNMQILCRKICVFRKKVVPLHAFFARRYQRVTAKRLKILTF